MKKWVAKYEKSGGIKDENMDATIDNSVSVSYTHLTLPTNREV